ncbi:MAG TPA: hypothetical protein VH561_04960 [Micromonosporaceae bacterium]
MDLSIEELERRMDDLRDRMRQAGADGDQALVRELSAQLRTEQRAWERALLKPPAPPEQRRRAAKRQAGLPERAKDLAGSQEGAASLVPLREQVHHALTLLTVPAAPRLITAVHTAFFGATIHSSRFTSLTRDEKRSFESSPYARPYYLCPALTADRLAPVRGLLSISTWPIVERLVGPLSPRVHFLTAAMRVAEAVDRTEQPRPEARRLLMRFAANIPGGADAGTPQGVVAAARAELVIHEDADRETREAAVDRTGTLTDVQRLFGVRLDVIEAEEDAG